MIKLLEIVLLYLIYVSSQVSAGEPIRKVEDAGNFGFFGDLNYSTVNTHNRTVMCMFDLWSTSREERRGIFRVSDINSTLCTHLVLRLVEIEKDTSTGNFGLRHVQNTTLYKQTIDLKKTNPKLKVMLSLGGWAESVADFQAISSDPTTLSNFTETVFKFLKETGFDGLNVEWNWPGLQYRGGNPEDKNRLLNLIDSLAKKFGGDTIKLELALTLSGKIHELEGGYDLPALNEKVDYFIVMGQDFAGNWDSKTGHHSALCGKSDTMSVGATVAYILPKILPKKLILGIPFAGRTFKLTDQTITGNALGASSKNGEGYPGEFNKDKSVLNYNEICYQMKGHSAEWDVYADDEAVTPFMRGAPGTGNSEFWISFDNINSVRAKVQYGYLLGIGGFAAWPINADDFRGNLCTNDTQTKIQYPLLRTINEHLSILSKSSAFTEETLISELQKAGEKCLGNVHAFDNTKSIITFTTTTPSPTTGVPITITPRKIDDKKMTKSGANSAQFFFPGIPALFILFVMQF